MIKKIWWIFKGLIEGVFWYPRDLIKYRRLMKGAGQEETVKLFPQLFDRDPSFHTFDKNYVYMDRWALNIC